MIRVSGSAPSGPVWTSRPSDLANHTHESPKYKPRRQLLGRPGSFGPELGGTFARPGESKHEAGAIFATAVQPALSALTVEKARSGAPGGPRSGLSPQLRKPPPGTRGGRHRQFGLRHPRPAWSGSTAHRSADRAKSPSDARDENPLSGFTLVGQPRYSETVDGLARSGSNHTRPPGLLRPRT